MELLDVQADTVELLDAQADTTPPVWAPK